MRKSLVATLFAAALAAACAPGPREPVPITPPQEAAGAAVVRRPIEPAPAAPASAAQPPAAQGAATAAVTIPADAIYVCVTEAKGERQQTVIEFTPRVHALCKRHPEMGPCQYERNVCRRAGGRVYAANGTEITMATEAEYDKKVMRVRFRAN